MITKDSKVYTVCSMDHAGGLLAQTLPAIEVKAQVHIETFNPFGWVKKIKEFTHSHLTPGMAEAITKTKSWKDIDLTGKIIACGSDRVPASTINQFVNKGCTFIVNWGMTEVGPIAINKTFVPDMEVQTTETIMGNMAYCDTKIVDGELHVKGDICIFEDWFATGDIVQKEDDDFYFLGRKEYGRK